MFEKQLAGKKIIGGAAVLLKEGRKNIFTYGVKQNIMLTPLPVERYSLSVPLQKYLPLYSPVAQLMKRKYPWNLPLLIF